MSKREFLVTEDGSHTLFVPGIDETYHSIHGAIQESKYVFILQGLETYLSLRHPKSINVIEVGFGTGLNALLAGLFSEKKKIPIVYETIEAFPLIKREVEKLNYPILIDDNQAENLFRYIHESEWECIVEISPWFSIKKINKTIQLHESTQKFDVCFFDAFAPSKQPEMWELNVFKKIHDNLIEGGVLTTYCAKGQLKRDLESIGFEVETLEGPPGKMEMVRGIKI